METVKKTDLLLLHGALGSETQFEAIRKLLGESFAIHTFNFAGHGGLKIPDEDFSIALFEKDVLNYMADLDIESAHIFGYSMGGYVGLSLAGNYPDKIKSVFTLATKFDWNPEVAQKETSMLNPDIISARVPDFAQQLEKRHHPSDWKMLLRKTADFMLQLGSNSLKHDFFVTVNCPVRLAVGDRDKMVGVNETLEVHKSFPKGSLVVFPQTQHPFELVNINRLVFEIVQFCKQ